MALYGYCENKMSNYRELKYSFLETLSIATDDKGKCLWKKHMSRNLAVRAEENIYLYSTIFIGLLFQGITWQQDPFDPLVAKESSIRKGIDETIQLLNNRVVMRAVDAHTKFFF